MNTHKPNQFFSKKKKSLKRPPEIENFSILKKFSIIPCSFKIKRFHHGIGRRDDYGEESNIHFCTQYSPSKVYASLVVDKAFQVSDVMEYIYIFISVRRSKQIFLIKKNSKKKIKLQ